MKYIATLFAGIIMAIAIPVLATDTVVLTPTALYDKFEKLETRIHKLENKVSKLEIKHSKVLKVLLNQNKKLSK